MLFLDILTINIHAIMWSSVAVTLFTSMLCFYQIKTSETFVLISLYHTVFGNLLPHASKNEPPLQDVR